MRRQRASAMKPINLLAAATALVMAATPAFATEKDENWQYYCKQLEVVTTFSFWGWNNKKPQNEIKKAFEDSLSKSDVDNTILPIMIREISSWYEVLDSMEKSGDIKKGGAITGDIPKNTYYDCISKKK